MKILIFTTARSDWNGLGMVARALKATGRHETRVAIMAHGPEVDETWRDVVSRDIRPIMPDHWVAARAHGSTQEAIASDLHSGAAHALRLIKPDAVLLAGDRYETLACALACATAGVPIVHLAGGDVTVGSADDRYRDAISALATLHCATTDRARRRLMLLDHRVQDRVVVTGSPAVDRIVSTPIEAPPFGEAILADYGVRPSILLQVHPNTMPGSRPALEADAICSALRLLSWHANVVAIGACEDRGKDEIDAMLQQLCVSYSAASTWVSNLPPAQYYWLMQHCDLMVGNSSAAYYEAPCFGLPCVDVGERQRGRTRPENVLVCRTGAPDILKAMSEQRTFGRLLCDNPYGDGKSAERVVDAIEDYFCVARAA